MHGLISALKKSKLFTSIDVIDLIDEETVNLIKIRADVLDGTVLYITELHTADYQKYSYHWQKEDGELIIRWDNKPHWKDIKTFPYHKHERNKIFPSHRVNIAEVIEEIKAGMARGRVEDVHKRNVDRKPEEIEAIIEEAVKAVRTRNMKSGDEG